MCTMILEGRRVRWLWLPEHHGPLAEWFSANPKQNENFVNIISGHYYIYIIFTVYPPPTTYMCARTAFKFPIFFGCEVGEAQPHW